MIPTVRAFALRSSRGCGRLSSSKFKSSGVGSTGLMMTRPMLTAGRDSFDMFAGKGHQNQQVMHMSTENDRPVSPHVTIMMSSFPLAAWSSITVRITGTMLTMGLYGIGYGALVGADVSAIASALGSSGIGPIVKFSVAFPLIYHYLGGLRHFYWEHKPDQLNPDSQKSASMAIYAASGLASFVLMFV